MAPVLRQPPAGASTACLSAVYGASVLVVGKLRLIQARNMSATGQQATCWEQWAATSLARLWQPQGKCQEAYALLVPVYGWLSEGFDTVDHQEARALLEALG